MKKSAAKAKTTTLKEEFKKEISQIKDKKESYSIVNFFYKSKNLLFKPTKFLNSIEKETRYQPILRTFVILYLIYFILTLIIGLIFSGSSNIYQIIISFIYAIIVSAILPFLVSGFVYLGVKIFKGKEGFFNVFKPVTYSLVILTIYGLIMLLFSLIVPFNNIFSTDISSLSQDQAIQIWKDYFSQPGAIINLLINLISIIHIFVFMILGISKFQRITKSKASFAIILSAVIALAIIILYAMISYLANPAAFANLPG